MFGHSAVAEQPFSVPAETTPNRFVYPVGIVANANAPSVSITATSLTLLTGVQGVGLNTPLDPIGVQAQALLGSVSVQAAANAFAYDQYGIVATVGGGAASQYYSTSKKFGTSSIRFLAGGGPITLSAPNHNLHDFSLDFWAKTTSPSNNTSKPLVGFTHVVTPASVFAPAVIDEYLIHYRRDDGVDEALLTKNGIGVSASPISLSFTTFSFFQLVRKGQGIYLWIDGAPEARSSQSTNIVEAGGYISEIKLYPDGSSFSSYDEIRLVDDTTFITPNPTQAYPRGTYAYLSHCDGTGGASVPSPLPDDGYNDTGAVNEVGAVAMTGDSNVPTTGLFATASVDETGPVVTANADIYPTTVFAEGFVDQVTAEGVALVSPVGVSGQGLIRPVAMTGDSNVFIVLVPGASGHIGGNSIIWSQIVPAANTVYTPITP